MKHILEETKTIIVHDDGEDKVCENTKWYKNKHSFQFSHIKMINEISKKIDIESFMKRGLDQNPKTGNLTFNNRLIENLDDNFLKYLRKFSKIKQDPNVEKVQRSHKKLNVNLK